MNKCLLCDNNRTTIKLGALPYEHKGKSGLVCPKCQREKLDARPYLLRDVPKDIIDNAKERAESEGKTIRLVNIEFMKEYGGVK